MRRNLSILCGAVLAGVSGIATPLVRAQVAGGESRVLVLPFATSAGGGDEWIGKAVQQDLFADLTRGATARVAAPSAFPAATDVDGALRAARDAGASIVVFGQAQASPKEIRLTGNVLDVATGQPLGALKVTGPADDLFHLEDALAGQIFVALPRTLLTAQTLQGLEQAAANPLARPPVQQLQAGAQDPSGAVAPVTATPQQPLPLPAVTDVAPQIEATDTAQPVVIDNGSVATAPYPVYNYDYSNTPVYNYYSVYSYTSPGCDVWPGVGAGIYLGGSYGCYDEYGGYGYYGGRGYGRYGEHEHGEYRRETEHGGYHERDGDGGREFDRSPHYPLADGASGRRFGSEGDHASRPSYLSAGHPLSSRGGFETPRGYWGATHAYIGASHNFSGSSHSFSSGGGASRPAGGSGFHAGGGGSRAGGGGHH